MEVRAIQTADGSRRVALSYSGDPVTPDAVLSLSLEELDGVLLRPHDLSGPAGESMDWLNLLPNLTYLDALGTSRIPVPEIPLAVLARLEQFGRSGRSRQVIHSAMLPRLRHLLFGPSAQLVGELKECPALETAHLTEFKDDSLRMFDGCRRLTWLRIEGSNRPLTMGWTAPPKNLEEVFLERVRVDDFKGIEELKRLCFLRIVYTGRKEAWHDLDLAPLASCRRLQFVAVLGVERVRNVGVLRSLPVLETVGFSPGSYNEDEVAGLRLT